MAKGRPSSKEQFAQSLVELSKKEPFHKITVEMIVEASGLSKRTFYNHFADKYDLAVHVFEERLRRALEATSGRSYYEFELACVSLFVEYAEYYMNAVRNTHGYDSIRNRIAVETERLFAEIIEEQGGESAIDEAVEFQLTFYAAGVITCYFEWYRNGMKSSAEDLARWCTEAMPVRLGVALGFDEWKDA